MEEMLKGWSCWVEMWLEKRKHWGKFKQTPLDNLTTTERGISPEPPCTLSAQRGARRTPPSCWPDPNKQITPYAAPCWQWRKRVRLQLVTWLVENISTNARSSLSDTDDGGAKKGRLCSAERSGRTFPLQPRADGAFCCPRQMTGDEASESEKCLLTEEPAVKV